MQSDILEHFLGQPSIPILPEEERLSCEGRITIEECVKALDTFENGKTVFLLSFITFFGVV